MGRMGAGNTRFGRCPRERAVVWCLACGHALPALQTVGRESGLAPHERLSRLGNPRCRSREMTDRILVAYASRTGATEGVAEEIGKQLANAGANVDVRAVGEVVDLSGYSAVVIGSAIRGGRWLPEATQFVRDNRATLSRIPTAYFLVCLMLAVGTEENRRLVATYLEPERRMVAPVAEGRFAGYLFFDRFSLLQGLGMRIFARSQKLVEGDYRDWDAVRAWADSAGTRMLQEGREGAAI